MNEDLLSQQSKEELEEYLKRSQIRNSSLFQMRKLLIGMKQMLQELQYKNITLLKKLNLLKDHAASLIQLIHSKNQMSISNTKKPILQKLSKVEEFSKRKSSSNAPEGQKQVPEQTNEDKLNQILADSPGQQPKQTNKQDIVIEEENKMEEQKKEAFQRDKKQKQKKDQEEIVEIINNNDRGEKISPIQEIGKDKQKKNQNVKDEKENIAKEIKKEEEDQNKKEKEKIQQMNEEKEVEEEFQLDELQLEQENDAQEKEEPKESKETE